MTKKHYIKFAEMVKDNHEAFSINDDQAFKDLLYILKADNGRFDEVRFRDAANMEWR